MGRIWRHVISIYVFLCAVTAVGIPCASGHDLEKIYLEYPLEKFIVGIGEVTKSGNELKDRTTSEINARHEISRYIMLRMGDMTAGEFCYNSTIKLFKDKKDCIMSFNEVVEARARWFKDNSTIVGYGEKNRGTVYSVAVMPRLKASKEANKGLEEAVTNTKLFIRRARSRDLYYMWKARDEYIKALAFNKEVEIINGEARYTEEFFRGLEEQILRIRERR